MDVIQCISRLRTNASEVPLPFENQQVLPGRQCITERQITCPPSFHSVLLGEQRDGDVKVWSKVDHIRTSPGEHGLTHLKAQILCVVRPGARVEVEYEVVPAIAPRWKALDARPDVLHVLS